MSARRLLGGLVARRRRRGWAVERLAQASPLHPHAALDRTFDGGHAGRLDLLGKSARSRRRRRRPDSLRLGGGRQQETKRVRQPAYV